MRFLLVVSVVGPLLLVVGTGWYNYGATFAAAEHELVRASEVAREHAGKVFDADKLIADYAIDMVRGMDTASIVADEASLHEKFRRMIAEVPQVQSVMLVDRTGDALVDTGSYPVAHTIDVAQRAYFATMSEMPLETYLSEVVADHGDLPASFGLVRRRSAADGSFDGLVNVGVSPSYFTEFDRSLLDQDGSIATLVRDDGQIIIRYPTFEGPAPRVPASSRFFDRKTASPEGGTYIDLSLIDGTERLYSFKRIPRYPAYVVVARPTASIVDAWRRTMVGQLLFGVPSTAALFVITLVALRRTRDQRHAVLQAQEEIRKREAAEQALHQAQKLEAIGQLTGGVAHDFNNLLTAVLGNLELIDMRTSDTALRRMVQTASRAAQRGAALTQQLLAFSRKQHLVPAPVDLNETVTTMCEMLGRTLGGQTEIETVLASSLWPALVDPTQIELAILNLTINARDAMPKGGTVVITTRNLDEAERAARDDLEHGDYVVVAVSDAGDGMTEEVKARAFEPFYTTKEVGKGSGLGLSQVYGLARQSGGTVTLHSAPALGTIVELILPRATEMRRPVDPEIVADVFERRRGLVLVVDDEEDVREVALAQLAALGYQTLQASSGAAALALIEGGAVPDLLMVDYAMPGMAGTELLLALRRVTPDLPAILVTGYAEPSPFPSAAGRLSVLRKPYRLHELAAKVDAALRAAPPAGA